VTVISLRPPHATNVAQSMELDAQFYRALAAEAEANPQYDMYGDRAETYAAGLAARYLLIAEFCAHEALRMRSQT
jgi:hypothetical protein